MSRKLIDEFYWNEIKRDSNERLSAAEKYKKVINWAVKARDRID